MRNVKVKMLNCEVAPGMGWEVVNELHLEELPSMWLLVKHVALLQVPEWLVRL